MPRHFPLIGVYIILILGLCRCRAVLLKKADSPAQNRAIDSANTERAHNQIEAARLASQKARFDTWAQEKVAELDAAQDLTKLDLDQKHHQQRQRLEARLKDDYGQAKATIKAELQAIDRRLEAKGVKKVLRDVFGRSRTDKTAREEMAASLRDIQTREDERRQALAAQQDRERRQLHERQEQRQQAQARGIEKARERAQAEHARKSTQKPRERPAQPSPTPHTAKPSQEHQRAAEPPAEPSERLSLDDKKRLPDTVLGERGKLEKPWQRASLSNDNKRPWQRDDKPAGRERRPDSPKTPKR